MADLCVPIDSQLFLKLLRKPSPCLQDSILGNKNHKYTYVRDASASAQPTLYGC